MTGWWKPALFWTFINCKTKLTTNVINYIDFYIDFFTGNDALLLVSVSYGQALFQFQAVF
jgi:hypothetical protein